MRQTDTAGVEDLVLRCHGCGGTVIYKRNEGEIEIYHSCTPSSRLPEVVPCSGWLIEGAGVYWHGRSPDGFGSEVQEAVRFLRQEDSERVLQWTVPEKLRGLCRTVEHIWGLPAVDYEKQYFELLDAMCSKSWLGRNKHHLVLKVAQRISESENYIRALEGIKDDPGICTRRSGHEGPCNGFPRPSCAVGSSR